MTRPTLSPPIESGRYALPLPVRGSHLLHRPLHPDKLVVREILRSSLTSTSEDYEASLQHPTPFDRFKYRRFQSGPPKASYHRPRGATTKKKARTRRDGGAQNGDHNVPQNVPHLEARAEGVPARVLSEHERRVLVEPDQLGVHDLVSLLVLQHPVLVEPGPSRETHGRGTWSCAMVAVVVASLGYFRLPAFVQYHELH